ncbi:MAG: D-xylose 1-dehydrogenase Gfo6 [Natronomonas sp.]|jgi:xylose dehydrogenase (NAD/NADP)|uniref:D-xylose 1-dehydrogenase Gfo6 n=1 Tax=Natronomonas sp. TaxID=2184060 RepID=UPI002870769A|nr:D-xylose 1-dehydrogenase Gfo6 [Natronomonas sp.]MDR9429384.1 D-xylose 1-dehydrogenase Gfo6 [Natronomonas sp.]
MSTATLFSGITERDWQTNDPEGTVRLALIGLGWWVREEAIPAIEQGEFCETTVVVSGSTEKAESVKQGSPTINHGLTYDEFHDGAAADAYDAVYICTPNATHLEYAETAAELGKDVLCEKPMEATVDRAERLVRTCDERDVTLMIAYRMQTEPAVRRARELIQDGFIGDTLLVQGHMSDSLLELIPDPNQWRLDPNLSGGCSLIDIGIYPLNTTRFLLDDDPTDVQGRTVSSHDAFAEVDEHATFQAAFPNGVSAIYSASHNAQGASFLKVLGSAGEITIEPIFFPWDDRELVLRKGSATDRISFEQVNQMTEEFDYFGYCLLTGIEPAPDGRHGLRDMQIIETIYESAADERWKSVPGVDR